MMDEQPNRNKQTIFHMGQAYLERVHELMRALDRVTLERDGPQIDKNIPHWNHNLALLIALYKELAPKMTEEERAIHENGLQVMKDTFKKSISAKKPMPGKMGMVTINTGFQDMFDKFELSLRLIAEKRGLLLPDKKSMDDAAEL